MLVYLDSNIVIYLVEQPPIWGAKVLVELAAFRASGHEFATSDASRLECLVVPYRAKDERLLTDYGAFFRDPALQVVPLSAAVCERAALIRAEQNLKPPDTLHLAAAVEAGCGIFLTGDSQLLRFTGLKVEVLT